MKPAASVALVFVGLIVLWFGFKLLTNKKTYLSGGAPVAQKDHRERPDPFAPARLPVPDPPQPHAPAPAPEPRPPAPRTAGEVLTRLGEGKQVVLTGKCQCRGELVLTADVLRFNCAQDRERDILVARSDVDRVDRNGLRIFPAGSSKRKSKAYHFKLDRMTNDEVHEIFTGWLRTSTGR